MFSFSSKPRASPTSSSSSSIAAPAPAPAPARDGDDIREQVKEWRKGLRHETQAVERQIREVQREEMKFKRECIALAKKDPVLAKMGAKNIVLCRRTVERLAVTRAQIGSISNALQEQAGMLRVAGALSKSAGIMKAMGELMNAPELMVSMRTMAAEMTKAGLISEIMDDAMAAAEPDGLDEEADEEVEKVMLELTQGMLSSAPSAPFRMPKGLASSSAAAASSAPASTAGGSRLALPAGGEADDDSISMEEAAARLRNI